MGTYMTFLERNWWLLALRGVAAILFGVIAFALPGMTLAILVLMFGAYVLADGVIAIIDSIRYRDQLKNWWLWLLEGVLGVVFGVLTLFMPGVTAYILLMFIAAWAIIGGVLRIGAAIHLRKEIEGEWLLALGGVVSIVFGVLLVVMPGAGILSLMWLIGIWAVLFGVVFIFLALRLRKAGQQRAAAR